MEQQAERPLVRVYQKGEEPDDVQYWLSRPPMERIVALEEIRKQYNDWKYGTGLQFQRVYSIVERKMSTGRLKDKVDAQTLRRKQAKQAQRKPEPQKKK